MTSRAALLRSLSLLLPLFLGCNEPPKPTKETELPDAGPTQAVLDSKLEAAMQAAAAPSAAPSADPDGPPQNGVFGPGLADKTLPPGAPAKIEILGEGSGATVTLAVPAAGTKQKIAFTVAARMAGGAMPTLTYALGLEASKPKDATEPVRVLGKVSAVSVPPEQAGMIPEDLKKELAKLKGTEVSYVLEANGAAHDFAYKLPKGADALDTPVRAMVETLSMLTVVAPGKPLGQGGFWMVTDRGTSLGAEVLRYRLYTITGVSGGDVELTVKTRQYATSASISLPMGDVPTRVDLAQYESQGEGKVKAVAGMLISPTGDIVQTTAMRLMKGSQQSMAQVEVTANLAAPPKK
jgi:hypothetical protein